MFAHFLVTQFNLLKFPLGDEIEVGEKWINWTRQRIKLFKKYCLPSLDNQSNKNFTWLIYFDKQTPEEFNDLIVELKSRAYIEICFVDGFDGFMSNYTLDVKEKAVDKKWVISSRIDNDDIFHKDAIQVIQDHFIPKDEYLISLTSGYTLNLNDNTLGHYYYPGCPFISLIEETKKKELKSIYYKSHGHWEALNLLLSKELLGKNEDSTLVLNGPYWIQVVHGDNVTNSDKRGMPVLTSRSLKDFALDINTRKHKVQSIFSFYNYVHWKRYLKSTLVKSIKSSHP